MKRTCCTLQLDISCARFYSCALCTTVHSQCKTNICWGLSCFQCGLEPLKPSRGHFPTVLEGQTPSHWMRTGFSGGACICMRSQEKQKGVMWLVGDFRFWESKGPPQPDKQRQTAVQSKDAHPCTYAHAIGPVATSKFQTRKQQELGAHQIGFKDICHWAATVSMNNSVLPEKAITVHVLK